MKLSLETKVRIVLVKTVTIKSANKTRDELIYKPQKLKAGNSNAGLDVQKYFKNPAKKRQLLISKISKTTKKNGRFKCKN